jgi:thiosulfate dehydrogenase [quinone] large subunit
MFTSRSFDQTSTARRWLAGTLWAVARIGVGWVFLQASLEKIGAADWTGAQAGAAVRGFLGYAASPQMTGGPHPNVLSPYAWLDTHVLLPHAVVLSYMVTCGEFLVGAALILGLGTRAAALMGAFLNIMYLLSGAAGPNVPMLPVELSIVLVGTTAGLIGLDTVLLPHLQRWIVLYRGQRTHGRRQDVVPAEA